MASSAALRTSVVIPAYRAWKTLPAVLEALRPQIVGHQREVIVLDSTGDRTEAELRQSWPWARFLVRAERTLPGRARNLAVAQAAGELVAFLDADAIPSPHWLDTLESSLDPENGAVAGSVLNGTPWSPVGTAGWLLEFSDWLPDRRSRLLHAPTCNLLLSRTRLEQEGGFVEDVWPGEDTILTFGLASTGGLAFAPDAAVHHLNRTAMGEFLRHQARLGAAFFSVCSRTPFPHRGMARPVALPLAGPFRLAALARRLSSHPRQALLAAALLPLLILGTVAWTAGLGHAALGLGREGPAHGTFAPTRARG